ncbi:hypothetical protein SAMN04487897_13341 [Paenibacillus sp. yr247]|nr:hypothetical protein SAMN04487897_13341 [Paenibacillus sp. yr247]
MIRLYIDLNESFANHEKGKSGESRGRKATGANVHIRALCQPVTKAAGVLCPFLVKGAFFIYPLYDEKRGWLHEKNDEGTSCFDHCTCF